MRQPQEKTQMPLITTCPNCGCYEANSQGDAYYQGSRATRCRKCGARAQEEWYYSVRSARTAQQTKGTDAERYAQRSPPSQNNARMPFLLLSGDRSICPPISERPLPLPMNFHCPPLSHCHYYCGSHSNYRDPLPITRMLGIIYPSLPAIYGSTKSQNHQILKRRFNMWQRYIFSG